jgi:hypothetical protein
MLKIALFTILSAASVLVMAGCESHQAKVDQLQKEYDRLSQQFAKDCSAEYLKTPPNLSPKCADESKEMGEAGKRLREEQAKK